MSKILWTFLNSRFIYQFVVLLICDLVFKSDVLIG
jgi:hypothetical protein